MSKIYTKKGDLGETGFYTGERVKKNDLRIEALGSVDELNSLVGLVAATVSGEDPLHVEIKSILEQLQHDLFTIGAELTMLSDTKNEYKTPKITEQHIQDVERIIDEIQERLPEQKSFILPGGTPLSAWLNFARTVTRRAERTIVTLSEARPINEQLLKYLNRVSDLFHILARYANKEVKEQQPIYKYFEYTKP